MQKDIKKLKEFEKWFNKFIEKNYGEKCPDFNWNCPTCHAHFVKILLDDFIEDVVETEKCIRKEKD